jgi:dTDP-4-amino-4,6-dideoxygalactose transaminase
MVEIGRRNADILAAGLADVAGITAQETTLNGSHAWHQFCILVDAAVFGCDLDELGERLKACAIQSGVHYPRGIHQQPIYEEIFGNQVLLVTEKWATEIIAIPVHHRMSVDDAHTVVGAIKDARSV